MTYFGGSSRLLHTILSMVPSYACRLRRSALSFSHQGKQHRWQLGGNLPEGLGLALLSSSLLLRDLQAVAHPLFLLLTVPLLIGHDHWCLQPAGRNTVETSINSPPFSAGHSSVLPSFCVISCLHFLKKHLLIRLALLSLPLVVALHALFLAPHHPQSHYIFLTVFYSHSLYLPLSP